MLLLGVMLVRLSLDGRHFLLNGLLSSFHYLHISIVRVSRIWVGVSILQIRPQSLSWPHNFSELLQVLDVALHDVLDDSTVLLLVLFRTVGPFVHQDGVSTQMD